MQEQTTPSELIGSRLRDRIKVYANINRATQDRTPAGFVKAALRARDQGFSAFKAAPFDGLTPSSCASLEGKKKIHHGIEVISALREALGSEALLMVDGHWRFDEAGAMYALKELQAAKLHWYECPIAETHAHWPATRRIRAAANAQGVLLAAQNGVQFSPHNPSGPICTWHSLQVAAAPGCSMLEIQFDESHLYDEIQTESALQLQNGELTVSNRPGFAPGLQLAVLEKHPYQAVPPGAETLLNR